MSKASRARSERNYVEVCQPTTIREYTSTTKRRRPHPEWVFTYVMSATHSRFGAGASR